MPTFFHQYNASSPHQTRVSPPHACSAVIELPTSHPRAHTPASRMPRPGGSNRPCACAPRLLRDVGCSGTPVSSGARVLRSQSCRGRTRAGLHGVLGYIVCIPTSRACLHRVHAYIAFDYIACLATTHTRVEGVLGKVACSATALVQEGRWLSHTVGSGTVRAWA